MAKKNQKQQQKRLQKKREKRKDRGRPPAANRPVGEVSEPFLEACWQAGPIPIPAALEGELRDFDAWATAKLETGPPPDRLELARDLGERMQKVITKDVLTEIGRWMYAFSDSPVQQKRVLNTVEAIPEAHWPFQEPLLRFLLLRWGESLPETLRRWLPVWVDLFEEPAELPFEPGPEPASWAALFEDCQRYGAALAWSAGPPELYRKLWEGLPASLGNLPARLGETWPEFLYSAASPDWVLALAEWLEENERAQDGYELLLKLAARSPEVFDVHEHLARLALLLEMDKARVQEHAREGLKALAAQPAEAVIDPHARDEYKARLEGYLVI